MVTQQYFQSGPQHPPGLIPIANSNNVNVYEVPAILGPDGKPIIRPYDGFAAPHVLGFNAILSSGHYAYYHGRWDEARRDSIENSLAMANDAHLQGIMQERKLAVASLPWHIDVPNERDPYQRHVRDTLTKILRQIHQFPAIRWALLSSIWYGRAAVQFRYKWSYIDGQRCLTVRDWLPINGDKLGFTHDHQPYTLMHSAEIDRLTGATYITTTAGGRGLMWIGDWRDRITISQHYERDDVDFWNPEQAGAVHGVGVRSKIYWVDWLRNNWLTKVTEFLERAGMGLELWYYASGDTKAKQRVTEAATKNRTHKTRVIVPWLESQGDRPSVEVVDVPMNGAQMLVQLMEYIDRIEERYIVGQHMSASAQATGLGDDGQADFQRDTKQQIRNADAHQQDSAITGTEEEPSLLYILQKYTFPESVPSEQNPKGFHATFHHDLEKLESLERLEAAQIVVGMGAPVKRDDLYAASGLTQPDDGDDVIGFEMGAEYAQQMAQGDPGQQQQPGEEMGLPQVEDEEEYEEGQQPQEGDFSEDDLLQMFEPDELEALGIGGQQQQAVPYRQPDRMITYDSGRWVTIGAKESDGESKGGSRVFIKDGVITKGHPDLTGKSINNMKGQAKGEAPGVATRRDKDHAVAVIRKEAKRKGINPKELDQLASELMAHDDAYGKDRNLMLSSARTMSKGMGYGDLSTIAARHSRGQIDQSHVTGLDDVAARMQESYPHMFQTEDEHTRELFDMLLAGNSQRADRAKVYEQALEIMASGGGSQIEDDGDPFGEVPFSGVGRMITYEGTALGTGSKKTGLMPSTSQSSASDFPQTMEEFAQHKPGDKWHPVQTKRGTSAWQNPYSGHVHYGLNAPQADAHEHARKMIEKRNAPPKFEPTYSSERSEEKTGFTNQFFPKGSHVTSYAELVGAPKGMQGYTVHGRRVPHEMHIAADEDTHHQFHTFERTAKILPSGDLSIYSNENRVRGNQRGTGAGLNAFSDQVQNSHKHGVKNITNLGARGQSYVGYKVWPKLGYDAPLKIDQKLQLQNSNLPHHVKMAETVLDLYKSKEGQEWWAKHGTDMHYTFDLHPDSNSMRTLNEYRQRKGLEPIEMHSKEDYEKLGEEHRQRNLPWLQDQYKQLRGEGIEGMLPWDNQMSRHHRERLSHIAGQHYDNWTPEGQEDHPYNQHRFFSRPGRLLNRQYEAMKSIVNRFIAKGVHESGQSTFELDEKALAEFEKLEQEHLDTQYFKPTNEEIASFWKSAYWRAGIEMLGTEKMIGLIGKQEEESPRNYADEPQQTPAPKTLGGHEEQPAIGKMRHFQPANHEFGSHEHHKDVGSASKTYKQFFPHHSGQGSIQHFLGLPSGSKSKMTGHTPGGGFNIKATSDGHMSKHKIRSDEAGRMHLDNVVHHGRNTREGQQQLVNQHLLQVVNAHHAGFHAINAHVGRQGRASGESEYKTHTGHKALAQLGYDAPLSEEIKTEVADRMRENRFTDLDWKADTVQDLIKTDLGMEIYEKMGHTLPLKFDLHPDSNSMLFFREFLQGHGFDADKHLPTLDRETYESHKKEGMERNKSYEPDPEEPIQSKFFSPYAAGYMEAFSHQNDPFAKRDEKDEGYFGNLPEQVRTAIMQGVAERERTGDNSELLNAFRVASDMADEEGHDIDSPLRSFGGLTFREMVEQTGRTRDLIGAEKFDSSDDMDTSVWMNRHGEAAQHMAALRPSTYEKFQEMPHFEGLSKDEISQEILRMSGDEGGQIEENLYDSDPSWYYHNPNTLQEQGDDYNDGEEFSITDSHSPGGRRIKKLDAFLQNANYAKEGVDDRYWKDRVTSIEHHARRMGMKEIEFRNIGPFDENRQFRKTDKNFIEAMANAGYDGAVVPNIPAIDGHPINILEAFPDVYKDYDWWPENAPTFRDLTKDIGFWDWFEDGGHEWPGFAFISWSKRVKAFPKPRDEEESGLEPLW